MLRVTCYPVALAILAFALGCGQTPLPPDSGGSAFWTDIRVDTAVDLGHEPVELDPGDHVPADTIEFVDVTDQLGLGGAIGGGNTHGVGIAFVDVTGDDLPDIFVANGKNQFRGQPFPSLLYRNEGDGFADITAAAGISTILGGLDTYSVAAGDYDNDGDVDLYVGAQPTDVLLRNRGDGTFEDATSEAGAGGPPSDPSLVGDGKSKVVALGDFDNDGDLDIASSSSTLPEPYAYLLRNDGDGTFTDITAETGTKAATSGNPCAIMWSDYDSDSYADLWIWNDRGGHVLLRNLNGVQFEDVTTSSGLDEVTIRNPMGIDAADIDHDGDLDYYVSNIGNNPLLRNNGDGTFFDITGRAGTGGEYGWGLAFEDFDGDTLADIFVGQEDNRPHLVFHNQGVVDMGDEQFSAFDRLEVPHEPVLDGGGAHNVAVGFADYDRDGRVDVVLTNTDGSRIHLYRNQTDVGSHRYLQVAVRLPDGVENSTGIGARIGVKTGDLIQFRDITGGSSRASQNEHSVRFGLGNWTGAEWVAVVFPTGRQIVVTGVEGNQRLVLP